jgi:hypothetical protein
MPAYARRDIVNDDRVGVYHCIARCVRRAFLCGVDPHTGRDYNHREEWVINRLRQLTGVFGVEVCSYAVMSNHVHLVLRIRPDLVRQWSDDEVALRWRTIFPLHDEATGEPIEPEIEIKKYLMLLDWTGRELRQDKRGAIPEHLAPILDRLGLERSHWVQTVRDFGRMFKQAASRWSSLRHAAPLCLAASRCQTLFFSGFAVSSFVFCVIAA